MNDKTVDDGFSCSRTIKRRGVASVLTCIAVASVLTLVVDTGPNLCKPLVASGVVTPPPPSPPLQRCLGCDILEMFASPSSSSSSSTIDAVTHASLAPTTNKCNAVFDHAPIMNATYVLNAFVQSAAATKCRDRYGSSPKSCNAIWMAYVGDSLLRSPFHHLIDTLLGREWPLGDDRHKLNKTTYHVDNRVCCHAHVGADGRDAPYMLNCSFSRDFDTPDYVARYFAADGDSNISPKESRPYCICITWQWNRLADNQLRQLLSNMTLASKGAVPSLVILNPGLHAIAGQVSLEQHITDADLLLDHLGRIAEVQQEATALATLMSAPSRLTQFVIHDITGVIDAQIPPLQRQRLNSTAVERFNASWQERLNAELRNVVATNSSRVHRLRVVPTHRLTTEGRERGLVLPLGDGIHYGGRYWEIVVRIHMHYLLDATAPSLFCRLV